MPKAKSYDLRLPVWKQGDDLAHHLHHEGKKTPPDKALLGLAEQYEEAARICRRVASVFAETPTATLQGDTHSITVEGPEAAFAGLVSDGILDAVEEEEDNEDD